MQRHILGQFKNQKRCVTRTPPKRRVNRGARKKQQYLLLMIIIQRISGWHGTSNIMKEDQTCDTYKTESELLETLFQRFNYTT